MSFLFWIFLFGIFVALLQDIKRREVDDWLNLFLFCFGSIFLIFDFISSGNLYFLPGYFFFVFLMFGVMNIFYYGRIFAGGDAKLLFSMSPIFYSAIFLSSFVSLGIFLLFLMVAGSIYGLFYSGILYFLNKKKVNKDFKSQYKNIKLRIIFLIGIFLFVLSYFDIVFLFGALIFILFPLLFVFSKSLEGVVMTRKIKGSELREGDWLAEDVKVGKKTIAANWEGLSLDEIKLLSKRRFVKIKEGLPFVPAFFVAYIAYFLFRDKLILFLLSFV